MVYNFSLPPLVLHAFHVGDATKLSRWAETLTLPSDHVTFFNFLASHDGIGLMPARGILSEVEIDAIAQRAQALGGHVSFKTNPDGSQTAYELNINYLDALGNPDAPDEDPDTVARRFLASQAIMLALRGVPGIYFHSLFGSRGWPDGIAQTGRYRTINREKLQRGPLESELADPTALRNKVFYPYLGMLKKRAAEKSFHPNGGQRIVHCHPAIFAVLRSAPDGQEHTLCFHNVSSESQSVAVQLNELPLRPGATLTDLITGQLYHPHNGELDLSLAPYQALWLRSPP
ncbi:MAG: alpha-glucosidase C-terminal domain-containing protein, partial [Anaerolineales bacterium]